VQPPPFLELAGHPLRWRLLHELGLSDRRVGELCSLAGERQNLVSYHLRRLREGGLVSARRSSADGRDTYYVLELERCRELLAGAASSLHPALGAPAPRAVDADVLFLCTGNSARSQLAEAFAARHVRAASAGSRPKPVSEHALRVLRARGLPVEGRRSKHLSEFEGRRFDYVITLCDRVREVCPSFPGRMVHWSVREPSSPEEFDAVADEIEQRVGFLLQGLQRSDHD